MAGAAASVEEAGAAERVRIKEMKVGDGRKKYCRDKISTAFCGGVAKPGFHMMIPGGICNSN